MSESTFEDGGNHSPLHCGGVGSLLHSSSGNPPERKQDAELDCVSGGEKQKERLQEQSVILIF